MAEQATGGRATRPKANGGPPPDEDATKPLASERLRSHARHDEPPSAWTGQLRKPSPPLLLRSRARIRKVVRPPRPSAAVKPAVRWTRCKCGRPWVR
jgi:hypothetical protein